MPIRGSAPAATSGESHHGRMVRMSSVFSVVLDLLIEIFGFILFAAGFLFVNRL
jgi:hypothetical protein